MALVSLADDAAEMKTASDGSPLLTRPMATASNELTRELPPSINTSSSPPVGYTQNEGDVILSRLGIISPSRKSPTAAKSQTKLNGSPAKAAPVNPSASYDSCSFEEVNIDADDRHLMVTASEGDDDSDLEVVFDRQTLLGNAKVGIRRARNNKQRMTTPNAEESIKAKTCRSLLVCLAFLTVGMCISIIGPTVPDLRSRTNSTGFTPIISTVSANGFGAILGVTFGSSLYACVNPFCLLAAALALCGVTTLVIPFNHTLTGVTLIAFIQGIFMGVVERGGYSIFYACWKKKYRLFMLFYFSMALGASLAPLVTTPFVFNKWNSSTLKEISRTQQQPAATKKLLQFEDADPSSVKRAIRFERSVLLALNDRQPTFLVKRSADITSGTKSTLFHNGDASSLEQTKIVRKPVVDDKEHGSSFDDPKTSNHLQDHQIANWKGAREQPIRAQSSPSKKNRSYLSSKALQRIMEKLVALNRVEFAYLVVALVAWMSTCAILLTCCCLRCSAVSAPSRGIDASTEAKEFHPGRLCQRAEHRSVVAFMMLTAALLIGCESCSYSLLTVYAIWAHKLNQQEGVWLTTVYWVSVTLSRLIVALLCGRQTKRHSRVIQYGLGGGLIACAINAVFGHHVVVVLWISTAVYGLATGAVSATLYCWLDDQLNLSPWAATLWLSGGIIGRLTMPLLTSYAMEVEGPRSLLLSVLVGMLLTCCSVLFLQRLVKASSHLLGVDNRSRETSSAHYENSLQTDMNDLRYDRPGENGISEDRVNLEMDNVLVEVISDDEDDLVFDTTASPQAQRNWRHTQQQRGTTDAEFQRTLA